MAVKPVVRNPAAIAVLGGLAPVADRYDGYLVDLWGCLHNGERAYPGAAACLDRLRERGGKVCLLSNAPRPSRSVAARLAEMGIEGDRYDLLVTSGDATRAALADPPDAWHAALGRRCYHLGPDRDRGVLENHPRVVQVPEPEQADFVLNTGPYSFDDPEDAYDDVLARCARLGLPMVCANPDIVVVVGDRLVVCAGALARRYEAMGGDVRQHGKPYPAIYRHCLALMGLDDPKRVLAVGDGIHTDVAGGVHAGMDTALIAGGIHRETLGIAWGEVPSRAALDRLVSEHGVTPTYVIPALVWGAADPRGSVV